MRRGVLWSVLLVTGTATALLLAAVALAAPPAQLGLTGVEPKTLPSETGGVLSIYGSGFTTATVARLVGYGLLDTVYVNDTALRATVPPGVPAGVYDLEVSEPGSSATLPSAITIVAPTSIPTPTPYPTPRPTPVPGRPILTIRNYNTSPSQAVAGQEFVVTIEIYNNGSRAGENTLVTFPGGTFLPVGETGHLLGQLHINHTAVITQRMRVPAGLASGTYNLQVNLSANDWEGNHYEYPQTVAVEVVGVGSGRPQLVVEAAHTNPPILSPGDAFSLTLRLSNRGSRTATRVLVGVASTELAVPAEGSNVAAVDWIGVGQQVTVTIPLVLGEVQQAGRRGLALSLQYGDYSGGAYADQQSVGLDVSTALSDRPQLLIADVHTDPPMVAPGDTFTLTLTVENVGGGEALRLTLTLGGEGGEGLKPFAPLDSGNVLFLPRLPAGERTEVARRLVVDGGANPGAYSFPVALAYDDSRGTRRTDVQLISLLVRRQPRFQIGFYQPVEGAVVGIPFELPVEVINLGRSLVNVSTVEITSEQLEISGGSMYFGPLDGGTSGSLEATAVAHQGGTAEVVVTVHYLDDFDQPQVVTQTLTVEVEEPQEPQPGAAQTAEETGEGFWDKVLRFLKGLLGLGS